MSQMKNNIWAQIYKYQDLTNEAFNELDVFTDHFNYYLEEQKKQFKALCLQEADSSQSTNYDSAEENIAPEFVKSENNKSTRPIRLTAKDATLLTKKQVNSNLTKKVSRAESTIIVDSIQVKQEPQDSNVLAESTLMPPPLSRPKRTTRKKLAEISNLTESNELLFKEIKKERISEVTRGTRSKLRNKAANTVLRNKKDSEVIMTVTPPVIIELSESEEEPSPSKVAKLPIVQKLHNGINSNDDTGHNIPIPTPPKKTRTKKKVAAKSKKTLSLQSNEDYVDDSTSSLEKAPTRKRNVSTSDEEQAITSKTRTKSKKVKKKTQPETEFDDADSIVGKTFIYTSELQQNSVEEKKISTINPNTTVVITTPRSDVTNLKAISSGTPNLMNKTVVLHKSKNETMIISPPNRQFQPVMADSLLTDDEDPHINRNESSLRAPSKSSNKGTKKPVFNPYSHSPVKQRVEAFEKMANHVDVPTRMTRTKKRNEELKKQQQDSELSNGNEIEKEEQIQKYTTPTCNNKILPSSIVGNAVKMLSASKTNSLEQKKLAIKRKEKEDEAQKKKEALLRQKAEMQKKMREEKQQRAKMTREAQEKEKRLMLAEREKQENETKLEKAQAEKEKKLRQKEENLRKIMVQKALEEKRVAEAMKAEKERRAIEAEKGKQAKKTEDLNTTPPLVDKNEPRPEWASSKNLYLSASYVYHLPSEIKSKAFSCRPMSIDLKSVFPGISPQYLKRKSSANWHTPPRMMKEFQDE